jgi:hypothetical protein
MSEGRDIRCYDYVNHPYEQVAEALRRDAVAVFHGATQAAASRAGDVAAELHVNIGGIDISTEIDISVTGVTYEPGTVTAPPATRLQLEWEARRSSTSPAPTSRLSGLSVRRWTWPSVTASPKPPSTAFWPTWPPI